LKSCLTVRLSAFVLALLFASLLAFTFASSSAAAGDAAESLYYWNGKTRVDIALALDELVLESDTVESAAALQRDARAVPQKGDGRTMHYHIPAVADKAALHLSAKAAVKMPGVTAVHAVLYEADTRDATTMQVLTPQLSLKLLPGANLAALKAKYNFAVIEKVTYSADTFIVEAAGDDPLAALTLANQLFETEKVEWATPLIRRQGIKRFTPNDPFFAKQWHLKNDGTQVTGAVAGNDVNISGAWDLYDGTGVNIGIVDDGLEVGHEDLAPNARTDIDIDINYGDDDPTPDKTGDNHGTSVAGVAAARGNNGVGVTGAAYKAGLVGIRIISLAATDAQEAQAMQHQSTAALDSDRVHISSNSWGDADFGTSIGRPGPLMIAARKDCTTNGRGGLGTVFVWAGGNGRQNSDDSNYDGYNTSPYVIAVAASSYTGAQSFYSENGCDLLVNAPSDDTDQIGITTTDRTGSAGYNSVALGNNNYTDTFGGTSSATPLVSGCIALMLQANPNLTWRDVRHLFVETSTKNSPADASWFDNAAGKHYSHKFGFGRVDATAAVTAAATWTNVPALSYPLTASESPSVNIPDNDTNGVSRSLTFSTPNTYKCETVQLSVNVTHPRRGDLRFRLVSPSGTVSTIQRRVNDTHANLSITFCSVANWGENANGDWTLIVSDEAAGNTGRLNSWSLTIDGTGGSNTPPPPPPGKADLQVTAISLPNAPVVVNTPFDATVTVKNNGGTATGNFDVSLFLNQSAPVTSSVGAAATQTVVGPLNPGESRDLVFSGVTYTSLGDMTLAAFADSNNAVYEASENNNMAFNPLTVLNPGIDLLISSVSKTESTPGINATFDVTIRNLGAVSSNGFSVGFYSNLFAAPLVGDAPTLSQDVNILNSNESITLTFALPTQNVARGGRAWFFADFNNIVSEADETNNIDNIVWGVANTPPTVTSPPAPAVPVASVGESVSFSVGVSDAEGDPLGYFWDFGDGTTQLGGPTISHTYSTVGIYTVVVTIYDGPFHTLANQTSLEIASEIVDLGVVSLKVKRGRIKLLAPRPAVFGSRDHPKMTIVAGNPGVKVHFTNFHLTGVAKVPGVFDFTVQYLVKKTGLTARVRYRYEVVP